MTPRRPGAPTWRLVDLSADERAALGLGRPAARGKAPRADRRVPKSLGVPNWDGWELLLTVDGQPQPWQRAGETANGRKYTPKETREAEALIAKHAGILLGGRRPLSGPVDLGLWFFRRDRHVCDMDNLEKLVKDALNGVAWCDDSQVTDCAKVKRIDAARPRTVIRVRPAGPEAWADWG